MERTTIAVITTMTMKSKMKSDKINSNKKGGEI